MQAMTLTKLDRYGAPLFPSKYFIDGKRVTREVYDAAHLWRSCDTFTSRQTKHRHGAYVTVRAYHNIRVQS